MDIKEKTRYFFEEAPVSKAIANFGVPMMVGMLVAVAYNLVDTAFIGMMKNPHALAAVVLSMPVFLIINSIGQVLGMGCGSYISRLLGQKDYDMVKRVSSFAVYGAIILGIIAIVLGFIFIDPLMGILGTSEDTIESTKAYVSIMLAGGLASILGFSLSVVVRAEGAAKVSMMGNIIGTVANIILDPIFIFGLGLGVKGAAIATVIANAIAALYYLWHIAKKSAFLSLAIADCKVDVPLLKAVFSIGFPSLIMNFIMIVGSLVQNNVAASFGDIYVATVGLIFKVTMLPKFLCRALCQGQQPLIGYSKGAEKFDRMKETVKKTIAYATIIGAVFALAFFLAGGNLLRLFIDNAEIIAIGTPFLRIAVISFFVYGTQFMTATLFQATGHAVPAFLVTLVQGTVFIPVLLVGTALMGFMGFAWALPTADVMAMLIGIILQIGYRKKLYAGKSK